MWKLELRKTVSGNRIQKCELFHPTVLLKQEHSKQNELRILEVLKNSYEVSIFVY